MERLIEKMINASIIPIAILNLLGGIVGGVWLLIVGEWEIVLLGVFAYILFPFVYSIVSIPTLALTAFGGSMLEKGKVKLGLTLSFFGMLSGHAINLAWVFVVFLSTLYLAELNEMGLLPLLLTGYGVATGPFTYMASKEPADSAGTYVALWLTQISYILLAVFTVIGLGFVALAAIVILTLLMEVYLLKMVREISMARKAFDESLDQE